MVKFIGVILSAAVCVAAVLSTVSGPASADALNFYATPASQAALRLDSTLGVRVVLGSGVDSHRTVSFSVADANTDTGRAFAVDSFARSLGANYRKVFVIRRATSHTAHAMPPIDIDATMGFHSVRIRAKQAIRMIAGVDYEATVHFYAPVTGWVTLSSTELSARQAAIEVAQQTHTAWTAEYVLTPARRSPVTAARIIGYTPGGQPITESQPIPGSSDVAQARYAHRNESSSTTSASNQGATSNASPATGNGQTTTFPTPPGYPFVYPPGYGPTTVGPANPLYEVTGSPFLYYGLPGNQFVTAPDSGLVVLPGGTDVFGGQTVNH